MRIIAFILFTVVFCSIGFSQEWRDSLMEARKLYKNGQYEESVNYYRSAQRLAPENIDLSQEEGLSSFRARMYPEAEKLFTRAATRQNDVKKKSSAYNNEGYARMQQQNYAGAEESFKNALRANPANEKARQNLAEAKRIRKKKEEEQEQKNKDKKDQQQDKQDQNEQQQNQGKSQGNKNQDQQNQSSGGDQKNGQGGKTQPKLSDKQTDRKLDELMRQEMGTKKRLDGTKNGSNGGAVRKDW